MLKIDSGVDLSGGRSDRATFWIVFGFMIVGLFVGQLVASIFTFVLAALNGFDIIGSAGDIAVLYDYLSLEEVLIGQSTYTLFFCFFTPWFYLRVVANKSLSILSPNKEVNLVMIGIAFMATFFFMFVNSYIVEWNQSWVFPEFLSGLENYLQELEQQLAETTERFTNFQTFGQFIIGLIVISVLPGIGEELLFRGLFQNSLQRWVKNHHIAIWVAAFVFSFIHFQFYGLVPRMVLGAIFGYLYVWSGNIWYPIVAHMTNNGISVLLVYLVNIGIIEMDIEDTEAIPFYVTVGGFMAFAAFMILFKRHFSNKTAISE
jgi:membrane protease YdiL (CAAX protease family)